MGARSSCCFQSQQANAVAQKSVKTAFVSLQAVESKGDAQVAVAERRHEVVEAKAEARLEPAIMQAAAEEPEVVGGCFLVYSEESQGTLRSHWSETELEGALAVLRPGKAVPRHKYTTNQGRSDILKQANLGVHKHRHCEGIAQFIKSGRAFDCQLLVHSDAVKVFLALKDDGLMEVSGLVNVTEAVALCVVARDVMVFTGVRRMNLEQFAFKAQHCGGGFVKF